MLLCTSLAHDKLGHNNMSALVSCFPHACRRWKNGVTRLFGQAEREGAPPHWSLPGSALAFVGSLQAGVELEEPCHAGKFYVEGKCRAL